MREVLEFIREHNGKWTWYQLERALWNSEISKSGKLMAILKQMEAQGLVVAEAADGYPGPKYRITSRGVDFLNCEE